MSNGRDWENFFQFEDFVTADGCCGHGANVEDVAEIANSILREELKKARKVTGRSYGDLFMPACLHEVLSMDNPHTHSALLINVKEIKP